MQREEIPMHFEYICVPERGVLDDKTVFRTYAVLCVCRTRRRRVILHCFHDVSPDISFVKGLARLCTQSQLSPCHFYDVFYDYTP